MPGFRKFMTTFALASALTLMSAAAWAATQTFTGKVSDAMCGAKHSEGVDPATCTRACVKKGAKYALVVGDKVYTLDTSDQGTEAKLSDLAWQQAKVTGSANGDTIEVKTVSAAK
jgi:hypothetical protein